MGVEELFQPKGFATDKVKADCDTVRSAFGDMAKIIDEHLPAGRYKSIVMTKLEETAMFATKAFTHTSDQGGVTRNG